MADAVAEVPEEPVKSSKKPLFMGLILALLGAGGGYFAVSSGLVGGSHEDGSHNATATTPQALPDIAFVEVEPIMISLSGSDRVRHLRFRSQLEVEAPYQKDVAHVLPRVTDVMNSYLRALELKDFEDPAALLRLRSQLLRRIQLVVGEGRVRDLLIMEFVLN
jgi:flagellar FliL protein